MCRLCPKQLEPVKGGTEKLVVTGPMRVIFTPGGILSTLIGILFEPGFLNLGTTDVLGWIIPYCGGLSCAL